MRCRWLWTRRSLSRWPTCPRRYSAHSASATWSERAPRRYAYVRARVRRLACRRYWLPSLGMDLRGRWSTGVGIRCRWVWRRWTRTEPRVSYEQIGKYSPAVVDQQTTETEPNEGSIIWQTERLTRLPERGARPPWPDVRAHAAAAETRGSERAQRRVGHSRLRSWLSPSDGRPADIARS